ncbi:MAG: hypothetical protein IJN27_09310 [Oscillospiraceae bacterium]|nr:hypothetical protein [Oscillospiraceae bacterium]
MNSRKNAIEQTIKYALLALCVFVLYILQGTPGFLQIAGVRPVLIIPFCINLAMLEDDGYSLIIYVIAGLLMELSAGRIVGMYTIPLIIACVICTILVKFVFQANYRNTVALSFACTFAILMLDFFFSYILPGHKRVFAVFIKTVFLSSCYSVVFSILYYKIISAIQNRFKKFDAR